MENTPPLPQNTLSWKIFPRTGILTEKKIFPNIYFPLKTPTQASPLPEENSKKNV
jgi:hypothetical protein